MGIKGVEMILGGAHATRPLQFIARRGLAISLHSVADHGVKGHLTQTSPLAAVL